MKRLNLYGSAAAFYVGDLSFDYDRVLVLVPEEQAQSFFKELSTFVDSFFLPAWDVAVDSGLQPSVPILRERLRLCEALLNRKRYVVVATVQGLAQGVCDPDLFMERLLVVVRGDQLNREEFASSLVNSGYTRVSLVESPGGFSVRGDVIDVFPVNAVRPVRIELWGDEVESIREFDPVTQRSIGERGSVSIYPFLEDRFVSLSEVADFDVMVAVEPDTLEAEKEDAEFWFSKEVDFPDFDVVLGFSPDLPKEVETGFLIDASLAGQRRIDFAVSRIRELLKSGFTGFVVVEGEDRVEPVTQLFLERGLSPRRVKYKRGLVRTGLYLLVGHLSEGFVWERKGVFFVSERDIFGRRKVKRRKRTARKKGALLSSLRSLSVGDYVIHKDHGIGRYLGLKKREVEGIVREFAAVEYKDGDILYVPVDRLNQLQKYVGAGGEPPRIDKLGGSTWRRVRERVKKEVEKFVEELLQLQAKRAVAKGYAFSPDTPWQREFEESFPFEETPDQVRAIEDVKRDMESEKPMDRLVCGDVGFGKTEVAMRAAFKAVMDGKQVAVLVPTTVLAEQHYETFKERFKGFPVNIEVLSRFRTKRQQKEVIEGLKKGTVDIVIGTHRLLSKDVQFKDLGLVIIDEEHKFGVRQKEKFKELRANVDVLMLSATPIPRTLNMALSGLRDISVIETPPEGRFSVRTFVATYRRETLRKAIYRELERGGRVFVVQNRIEGLEELRDTIRALCPKAKVDMAHGKMKPSELEEVMYRFVKGEVDVLVSTAIVEAGLDIPNANTLIVVGAEKFGLAQLYQLRGRVGRGNEVAYAYFLVSPGAVTEEAKKRLRALQEFSELGSGLRLALRDMEIRGVGNILGKEQSGHVAGVGLEEYLNLLEEAVAKLKGEPLEAEIEPTLVVSFEAYIPDYYVGDENVKMAIYRRLMSAELDEIDEIKEEVRDRFGQMPDEVKGLFILSKLKVLCRKLGIVRLQQRSVGFLLEVVDERAAERILSLGQRFVKKKERLIATSLSIPEELVESLSTLVQDRVASAEKE